MKGDIERRPLAKALGQYVPAFMVPNVFRQVESMPLTKNGKIDRKALTAMYQEERNEFLWIIKELIKKEHTPTPAYVFDLG